MDHLDDCPICAKVAAGEIEKDGDRCCLVLLGGLRLATLKNHAGAAEPLVLYEAVQMLQQQSTSGYVAEYTKAPGHWALQLIHTEAPAGESRGK